MKTNLNLNSDTMKSKMPRYSAYFEGQNEKKKGKKFVLIFTE